jgi:t-SNARE complex subunit (syntaxin)
VVTSVHIPDALLAEVDRRARELKIGRDELIVKALERELAQEMGWSRGFVDQLSRVDEDTARGVDEMMDAVRSARRSREPRRR